MQRQTISINKSKFYLSSFQASISDSPSYPHRGISVDTSRNFMPIPVLKELIDGLGMVKMNTFHWHMTDSQVNMEAKRKTTLAG